MKLELTQVAEGPDPAGGTGTQSAGMMAAAAVET